jgi:hypothetical protein
LRRGLSASCGCVARERNRFIDITGKRFGRWTVRAIWPQRNAWGQARWSCRCDCGAERIVCGTHLRRGLSTSCGCRAREISRERAKHGLTRTRIYRCWQNMKRRCFNPQHPQYANYGARGIGVCEPWYADVRNFHADVGDPPPGKSLDRIDNNRGYEPGNVRWATAIEQARNQRPRKRKPRRSTVAEIQAYAAALAWAASAPDRKAAR